MVNRRAEVPGRKQGIDGLRTRLPRVLRRTLAAGGIALALASCGDLSLVDALKGDSPGNFRLTPDSLNLPTGSQYSFTAAGGIAPYRFVAAGVGLLETQSWTYTAPSSVTDPQGWDQVTITATDRAGNCDTATVRVFPAFELYGGASLTLTQGDPAHRFSVSGGVPPYTWLVDETKVAERVSEYFFDPAAEGVYLLAVHDGIGNYREAAVTVVAGSGAPLAIEPPMATVLLSSNLTFNAHGGDGPGTYLWSATAGTIVPTGPKSAELTAPGAAGELIVTLSSGSWDPIIARVVVTDRLPDPLLLLPDAPVVGAIGDTVRFSASGGTPPFQYILKNQYKNWATITADGLYTHEKAGKNVVVTVADSGTPVQSASTTVYWQQ
jgi:hypothetical protein